MPTVAEALGYAPDASLLVVHCDDLGMTRAANVGIYDSLRDGLATSASLMVPAPWARDAAAMYRGEDVGVHLTATSEWDTYRWGPITVAPSLLDGNGGFPQTRDDVWEHADIEEVRREARAQVERAIVWGFDISHIDSHMWTFAYRPEFFDVAIELAVEYRLPMRLPTVENEARAGFPYRKLAAEEGVLVADHTVHGSYGLVGVINELCANPRPGLTDLFVHPAEDTPELRAACRDADNRVNDLAALLDGTLAQRIADAGITCIDYRALRDAQRAQ
jgi:hypothetical protein